MQNKSRIHGLDTLRAIAIILVFMYHYKVFVTHEATFGFLSTIGWVGVDLFFVLSGYLIGNQVFSLILKKHDFSLTNFYLKRLLRTLPNYLFVLSLYFLVPIFREKEVLLPLWKFLTFTQNFDLKGGTAFSHAWSLCIEEQFYCIFPVLALLISSVKSVRIAWIIVISLLIGGVILRSIFWIWYVQDAGNHMVQAYHTKIYFSSLCRLDGLLLGVSIAIVRNFHKNLWAKTTEMGNPFLLLGVAASSMTFYMLSQGSYSLWMSAFGFLLLAFSFSVLTISALSPSSFLYRVRIPGATSLAVLSYAIYLLHKPITVLTISALTNFGVSKSSFLAIFMTVLVSISGGALLYFCVEAPFLRVRDLLTKKRLANAETNEVKRAA